MLLSACLIVKDEEENLVSCLASLSRLVDEVVIYDTGSTDDTLGVARREAERWKLPLTLVEGYWNDDFARARNASLEHCAGIWVLWIDADEVAVCDDPRDLHYHLDSLPDPPEGPDAVMVRVTDLPEAASASVVRYSSPRLFRRVRCHWVDRLHEQVRVRGEDSLPVVVGTDHLQLHAAGHDGRTIAERGKLERNIRIAQAALDDEGGVRFRARALVNLGRTLWGAGRPEEARAAFEESLAEQDAGRLDRRFAFEGLTFIHVGCSRWEEAERCLAGLWHACELPTAPLYLRSVLTLRRGLAEEDPAERKKLLRGAIDYALKLPSDAVDDDGTGFGPDRISLVVAEALAGLGDFASAAATCLEALAAGYMGVKMDLLLHWLDRAGVDPAILADAIPPWLAAPFCTQLREVSGGAAAVAILTRLAERWPDQRSV